MRTQRTHIIALRAAGQVTAVSRYFRRAVIGAAATVVIAGAGIGCSQDSEAGASADASNNTSSDASAQIEPDVAGLIDTILMTDEDGGMATSADSSVTADVGSDEDTWSPDVGATDAGTPDVGIVDAGAPDAGVLDAGTPDSGVMVADAGNVGIDAGPLPEDCLIPNGAACSTATDCQVEDKYSFQCLEGECHEMDITPNAEAAVCCQHQYDAGNFGVAGCNPWGPPAPPLDRGYRLADLANTLGIA
ncbi:MAG: hypothetical protein ACI9OJ_005034 [Myxococcota bacterium]|jgi:hypothetical protein